MVAQCWCESHGSVQQREKQVKVRVKATIEFGFWAAVILGGATPLWAAPVLHALFVVDTESHLVGADITESCMTDLRRYKTLLGETFEDRGDRLKIYDFQGSQVAPGSVLGFIEQTLQVNADDTIWFHYCGHGATDEQRGHFLATSQGDITRSAVRDRLERKGVRLVVLTTDACSSPGQFSFLPPRRVPASWEAFSHLFFQHRGITDITAATDPQFAWGSSNSGGFFGSTLARLLCEEVSTIDQNLDGFANWDEAFAYLWSETRMVFRDARANALRDDPQAEIGQSNTQDPHAFSLGSPDRASEGEVRFSKKFRVVNNSDNTLRLELRFLKYSNGVGWHWAPGIDEHYRYSIAPGRSTLLRANDELIRAHKIVVSGSSGDSEFSKSTIDLAPRSGYRAREDLTWTHTFTVNGKVEDVTVRNQHNVSRGGRKGLLIQVGLETHRLRRRTLKVNALFYLQDDSPLKDFDGEFTTSSGQVGVASIIVPKYLHTSFAVGSDEGIELFVPYEEMHLGSGRTDMYYRLHVSAGEDIVFHGTTKNKFNVTMP